MPSTHSKKHAKRRDKLAALARSIADEAAGSDVRVLCLCMRIDGTEWWLTGSTTPRPASIHDRLQRALAYLELRGLLELHPRLPVLVRFAESGSSA